MRQRPGQYHPQRQRCRAESGGESSPRICRQRRTCGSFADPRLKRDPHETFCDEHLQFAPVSKTGDFDLD
jgi:hypothetical protein